VLTQPAGQLLAFPNPRRSLGDQLGHHVGVHHAGADGRGDRLQHRLVGPDAPARRAGPAGARLAVAILRAAALRDRRLAVGADHSGRLLVAKLPLPAAAGAGGHAHAGRAGGHQRAGQLEQQPAARLPTGKARAGRTQPALQLDQRPRRGGHHAHHRGQDACVDGRLELGEDGQHAIAAVQVALLLAPAVPLACLAGSQLWAGGSRTGALV
jgi:hypothetical protein